MILESGVVYHLFCKVTNPPKTKFVICVCPENMLFLFVNSKYYEYQKDDVCHIEQFELPFLKHRSYIDVGQAMVMHASHYNDITKKAVLSNAIRIRIKDRVTSSKRLVKAHKQIILNKF